MRGLVRQTEGLEELVLRIHCALAAQIKGEGDACGDAHAEGDGPAVGDTERGRGLERVAGGVAVVEDRAWTAVALVLGHDQRLGGNAPKDDAFEHRRVALDQTRTVSLQHVEQAFVHGDGVLYNLGESVPVVRHRKRLERREVGEHGRWLPEGPDRVLRPQAVDPGLAADARVHHGQERRGHSNQPDATLPDRCRQAGEVADGASPDGDDATATVDVLPLQKGQHGPQLRHGLRALAGRDGMDGRLEAGSFDRLGYLHRVRPDIGVGDDRGPGRIEAADDVAQLALQVGPDEDGIAPRGRVEDQSDQSFRTSSATTPGSRVPSTV